MNNLCNQILIQNTIKIAQKGKNIWLRLPTLYVFPIKYILVECIDSVVFPVKREGDTLLTPRIPLPTLRVRISQQTLHWRLCILTSAQC